MTEIDNLRKLFRDILLALEHIHSLGVIHGDVKVDNILHRGVYKLCDFGLARKLGTQAEFRQGTLGYMAPEIEFTWDVTQAVDMWAFGVCVYELAVGNRPQTRQGEVVFVEEEWKDETLRGLASLCL